MKNLIRNLFLSTLLLAVSAAYGAGVAPMDVTVSGPGGKVAYKGKTDANGTFSTPKLAPGNYTVQFNSPGLKAGQYVIVVSAGKKKVSADSVIGDKFAKGGVAMKVDVGLRSEHHRKGCARRRRSQTRDGLDSETNGEQFARTLGCRRFSRGQGSEESRFAQR